MENEPFYYVSDQDEVYGPWTFAEIRSHWESEGFSEGAQILVKEEWRNLTEHLLMVEQLRNELASQFMGQLRGESAPPKRGMALFDILIIGLLWWWFWKVEWPAVGGLAFAVTAWTVGQVIAMASQGILNVIGQLIQGFGGMIGFPAIIWLVWTMIVKLA